MPDVTSSNSSRGDQIRQRIGKYQIFGRVGRGGMGSVYRAYDPVLERLVALKVVSAASELTDELRTRFFLEAQACARLAHPNIVTIYDLGEADGQLFIVMELLDGEELRQLIARRPALSVRDKLALMTQVCDGLEYAHGRGILHRDVKPGNIFVQRDGRVKILDFGVARIEASNTPVTRTGLLVGTLQYMAPERVRGHGDARSDIFAVGAVLYELLTYRAAFGGAEPMEILEKLRAADPEPPSHVDALVPSALDAVVVQALDKNPDGRFENLGRMSAELRAIQQQLAVPSASDTPPTGVQIDPVARVRALREALVARVGASDRVMSVGQPPSAGDGVAEIPRLLALLARAERLQPVLDDGLAAMAGRDYDTAITILGWIAREMPEHARAIDSLSEARRRAETARAGGPLVDDARAPGPSMPATDEAPPVGRAGTEPGGGTVERDDDSTMFAEAPLTVAGPARPIQSRLSPRALGSIARALGERAAGAARPFVRWLAARPVPHRRALFGVGVLALVGILTVVFWPRTPQQRADPSSDLRKAVAAAREIALGAEAPTLAAPAFSAAETASAEAERLAKSRGDSAPAFRTAAQRYEAAGREAAGKREGRAAADAERQRMVAARQRAPETGAERSAALEAEEQGNALYTRLEFEEASRSFRRATELYARPVPAPADTQTAAPTASDTAQPRADPAPVESPRPPPAATPDSRAEIRGRLADYARAIETKNLALLRQVRPSLSEADVRRWTRVFEMTRSRKVGLTLHDIAVDGEQAQVTGRRAEVVVLTDGQRIESETRFVCTLARRRDGWVIVDLRETKDVGPDGSR